jgi:hypothetical protein
MAGLMWEEEKEERRKESIREHERLSKLFKEDRLSFERERKNAIKALIDQVEDEGERKKLWELQNDWDRKMKGAGTAHNRFVLAQMFFWEHFQNVWNPAIQQFNRILNKSDRT